MRRALGKGLTQLLGDQVDSQVTELNVDQIFPRTDQPRKQFDETTLRELADSIRNVGILQPLVVRIISEGRYEIVAGERRFRAAKLSGLSVVPVWVKNIDHDQMIEVALIENIQRENLNAYECALAYRTLMDEYRYTQEQLSEKLGKSRSALANTLRLLKLQQPILDALSQGALSEGHARALLSLQEPEARNTLFEKILSEGLSVRQAEKWAKLYRKKMLFPEIDSVVLNLEKSLQQEIQRKIRLPIIVEMKREDRGRIVLEFKNQTQLEKILSLLN